MKKSLLVVMLMVLCFLCGHTDAKALTDQDYRPQLTKKKITLEVGEIVKLDANCYVTSNKGNWKSSNTKVATIKRWDGQVTAKKVGKTTITLEEAGKTYTCKLTVVAKKKKKTAEVKALKKLIKTANKKGGKWPTSINSKSYQWHGGHLIGIDTSETKGKVKEKVSLSAFPYLKNVAINNVKSIDVKKCKKLESLQSYNIQKVVDVTKCKKLRKLTLEVNGKNNQKINISKNTKILSCDITGESISSIDLNNCNKLEYLSLSESKIQNLNLNLCKNLKFFDGGSLNKLSTLKMDNCKKIIEFRLIGRSSESSVKKLNLCFKDMQNLDRLNVQSSIVEKVEIDNCDNISLLGLGRGELNCLVMTNCECDEIISLSIKVKSVKITNCISLTSISVFGANEMNVSGCPSLTMLGCIDGALTDLNSVDCSSLTSISCRNNKITSIDITRFPNLQSLDCTGNLITSLDLTSKPNLMIFCDDSVNVIGRTVIS